MNAPLGMYFSCNDFRWPPAIYSVAENDFLLMLDGQLFHFPARKSQNAKEMVFKVDTPVCIITKTAITLAQ